MIEFSNVTKLYGTVIGVNDVTITLTPGAYGLLGPNGSGKTTFINLVTGQLRPTIGQVRVFGMNPRKNDQLLTRIGLCPAIEPVYPQLSGFDWVAFLTRLHGFSPKQAADKAAAALEQVGMTSKMDLPMSSYSLGMRQRCKLAQAIAHEPELLILDEPFNGLDPVGRIEMTEYLRNWIHRGRSVILASHVLHEVEAIDPSFLLISGGRLLASGSPREVRELMTKDHPDDFWVVCDRPQELATKLLEHVEVEKIDIDRNGNEVRISTRQAKTLAERLADLSQGDFKVVQVASSNESFQDLFTNLLKRHRGEV